MTPDREKLLGPTEVADFLGIPVRSLYMWRLRGTGPRSMKVGRHVRYRPQDIEAWLDRQAAS